MQNLSKLCSVVFVLITTSLSYAQDSCVDKTVGKYKKTIWENSLSDGLRGELVNQIARKENLFQKIRPEIEIGNDIFDFKLTFTRNVNGHQPFPETGKISETDLFKFKINNSLNLELKGRADSGVVFTEAFGGVELTHSTEHIAGQKTDFCDTLGAIIDSDSTKGKELLKSSCSTRDKSSLSSYYDVVVDYLGSGVSWILNIFAESENNVVHAKAPLEPMKLHSKLGIPMDPKVFYENNADISIGDIIEHTTYYNWKPIGVNLNLFSNSLPSYAKFIRYFRTLTFKKAYGNKVIVEVTDTEVFGTTKDIFKIRPKVLWILKLNLGRWTSEEFKERSLTQRFEVDLNMSNGESFFNELLLSAYGNSLVFGKKPTRLVDHTNYEDAVVAHSPIYRDGYGSDSQIILKLPGTFDFRDRSFLRVSSVKVDAENYSKGELLHRESFRNKFSFDIGIFELKKKDKNYECQMLFDDNESNNKRDSNSSALNIECSYTNRYADNSILNDVYNSLKMTINQNLELAHDNALINLNFSKPTPITMYTNLSLSSKEIMKLKTVNENKVYHEYVKLLFGDDTKNIFHTKYHDLIEDERNYLRSMTLTPSPRLYKCSQFLANAGITDKVIKKFDEFKGIVGRKKGIESVDSSNCYSHYRRAKRIASYLVTLKQDVSKNDKIKKILEAFDDLEYAGMIQNLLVRLTDGVNSDGTRYTYIVTSPKISSSLVKTNGTSYTANLPNDALRLSSELDHEFIPRIESLDFSVNSCLNNKIKIETALFFPIEDNSDLELVLSFREFSVGRDEEVFNINIPFKSMNSTDGKYSAVISVPDEYKTSESHNVYTKVINSQGERVTKEFKTFIRAFDKIEFN